MVMNTAQANGGRIDWINCGLCVDERGVGEAIAGTRRGRRSRPDRSE